MDVVVSSSKLGSTAIVKERHRWQPEEDALLRAYVRRYGARDWALLPQRMGRGLLHHRDPKSCQDRWKNYLRPGLKKGSLTPDEQALLVSLQAKLGNRWKLIAAQLPGRTPKRLGKWWDAFKDRQLKLLHRRRRQLLLQNQLPQEAAAATYEGSLQTALLPPPSLLLMSRRIIPPNLSLSATSTGEGGTAAVPSTPTLSLATHTAAAGAESSAALSSAVPPKHPHQNHLLPAWMSAPVLPPPSSGPPTGAAALACAAAASCSPSVSLSLSPSSGPRSPCDAAAAKLGRSFLPLHQAAALAQLCLDLEEGRHAWAQHRKETSWRLSRLEQQLETEKARKRKEVTDDVEAKIRCLREEEAACLERLEADYREQLGAIQRDAEAKEAKMTEALAARHTKLTRLAEQVAGSSAAAASPRHFTVANDLH